MSKDYIAIVLISGGSSWHRAPTEKQALTGVARRLRADWGKLFHLPKGEIVPVTLVDVSGYDDVLWDSSGIWSDDGETRTRIAADRISRRSVKLT